MVVGQQALPRAACQVRLLGELRTRARLRRIKGFSRSASFR